MGFLSPSDGDIYMSIAFPQPAVQQDERLVLPKMTIKGYEQLSFDLYTQPWAFFNTEKVDWSTMEWIGEPEVKGDVTVEVRENGGDWKQLWSYLEPYKSMSLMDLLSVDGYFRHVVDLSEYKDKEIEICFRYNALDCNTITIDLVTVGLPSLDNIAYSDPYETFYWGSQADANWSMLTNPFNLYPVHTPISWENVSEADAEFYWDFHNGLTNAMDISNEQYTLTAEYAPDYSSEFTCRNNLFYMPTLHANAPGATEGVYTSAAPYLQAGGRPDFISGGTEYHFGVFPFNAGVTDFTVTVVDDEQIGDMSIPIFGHSANSDKFWLNYKLNGEPAGEGDDVKTVAILNYMAAPLAPFVVDGAHVLALGQMSQVPEFRIDIIALTEEFTPEEEPIATAICAPEAVIATEQGTNNSYTIPFKFDAPVVIDDSHPAYYVRFSGFNNEGVEYFAPVQSMLPDETRWHGYLEQINKINSDEYRTSYFPVAYVEGANGPLYNSFAIALEGAYPWLDVTDETEEVKVAADGTPTQIALGSYYDGSDLQISQLAGVQAKAEGRYGECVLTLSHDDTEVEVNGDITVSAPGVSRTFHVTQSTNSINDIKVAGKAGEISAVYTIAGERVNTADLSAGVYVVRYADGKTRKLILR